MSADYWSSDEGIFKRLDLLSQGYTWDVYNKAMYDTAKVMNIKYLMWTTHPELSRSGSCLHCAAHDGRPYRIGQFLPSLPVHANCCCDWDVYIP